MYILQMNNIIFPEVVLLQLCHEHHYSIPYMHLLLHF